MKPIMQTIYDKDEACLVRWKNYKGDVFFGWPSIKTEDRGWIVIEDFKSSYPHHWVKRD